MKDRVAYVCSSCGAHHPKWLGRCSSCGEWNSLVEQRGQKRPGGNAPSSAASHGVGAVAIASVDVEHVVRIETGLSELDRVLGGGFVPASSVVIAGEPGIGKSTLLLQVAAALSTRPPVGRPVVYVNGEESREQISLRSRRLALNAGEVLLVTETILPRLLDQLASLRPSLVVVDSIQTISTGDGNAVPGGPSQVKSAAHDLVEWARAAGAVCVMVAHVTKDGTIAGPKALEHLVDAVLTFEIGDEPIRMLRAAKNRFGATDEIGLFSMGEQGLRELAVTDQLLLRAPDQPLPPGVAIAPVYEGTRTIVVEIQALTVPAQGGVARTISERVDPRRVGRIAAVLERHVGVPFSDQDTYVNVAGGIRLTEVGVDLPLAAALYSARLGVAIPHGVSLAGELTLAGEVRPVRHLERRVRTMAELGFGRIVTGMPREPTAQPGVVSTSTAAEAMRAVFGVRLGVGASAGGKQEWNRDEGTNRAADR